MKFVKFLLMGLGALVIVVGSLLTYLVLNIDKSTGEQQAYVQGVLADLSVSWNPEAVNDRLAENLIGDFRQVSSAGGFRQLSQLGRFLSIQQSNVVQHRASTSGSQTVLDLLANYENGRAKVRAVILGQGASRKLVGFSIFIDGRLTSTKIQL